MSYQPLVDVSIVPSLPAFSVRGRGGGGGVLQPIMNTNVNTNSEPD